MTLVFCPGAIVWGDVATWASGIASFLAVGVALWIAKQGARDVQEREKERRERQATAIAVAIHAELVPLVGAFNFLVKTKNQYGDEFKAAHFEDLRLGVQQIETPVLDRLFDRLDVFSPSLAGQLMIVYRGVIGIHGAVKTPQAGDLPLTDAQAVVALAMIANIAKATEGWIYACLDALSELAQLGGFQVISTDAVRAAVNN